MSRMFQAAAMWLLFGLGSLTPIFGEEADPGEKWVTAYGWLQTGDRLADAELWPLAMGSYLESHRQIEDLKAGFPSFEPEVVAYRLEALEKTISGTQEKLTSGEHDIMMKYLDFIESYELGMRQRFQNQFVEALDTLDVAKVLLDEIIYEKPDEFRDAVDAQYQLLHSSLGWLDQQINFKQRSRRVKFVPDGVEWGTTEFVKEDDLPDEGETVLTSGALFPGLPDPKDVADLKTIPGSVSGENGQDSEPEPETKPDKKPPAAGPPGFRMSSKKKEIPKSVEEEEPKPE